MRATWAQRFESARLTVHGVETDPYTLATLTLRKASVYRGAELLLQVRNVFDARYATPGGFEHRQASIPQDGRTWALRVGWTF
jgi:iron complex outermembrane receptor protein